MGSQHALVTKKPRHDVHGAESRRSCPLANADCTFARASQGRVAAIQKPKTLLGLLFLTFRSQSRSRSVLQIRCCLIIYEKLAPLSARGSSSDRDRHGQVRCAFNTACALLHCRQLILRSQTVHTTHSVCQTVVTCHCRKTYEVCYPRDRSLSTAYRGKVGVWSCLFTVAKDQASLKCATGVAGTVIMELCTQIC